MDKEQKRIKKNEKINELLKEKNKEIRSLKLKLTRLEKRLKEKNEKFMTNKKELNTEIKKLRKK